jgi:hypothetical protein
MNRNQKIALGCGGAGCLGLIVVAIAGGLIYYFAINQSVTRGYNYNVSTNRNSNLNDNSNITANTNNNSSNSSSTAAAASMSDDDKHKLYQAAAMTGDGELLRRVSVKIGLMNDDYSPGDNYQQFLTAHVGWVIGNTAFIRSIGTEEKARAYVNDNIPD